MEKTENVALKNKIIRRIILALIMLAVFSLQTTKGLFPAPFGIHAMLLIPLTVSIAMFEREFAGVFFGLAAGMALDAFSSDSICFNSIAYTVMGITAGALITYLMRNNLLCAVMLTSIFTLLYNSLSFFIFYAFKGIENPILLYLRYYFVSVIFTVILCPVFYIIVRAVSKKFR